MFEGLEVREVTLEQGPIRYREVGEGPILLFVHGVMVSGSLWRKLLPRLSRSYRCIVPDWPLGSHTVALRPDADRSPPGLARIVASFVEALDLREVTLVGNDSGGAICQLVVTRHPQRIGRLVLTTCDAFELFPPPAFAYVQWLARVPGALWLIGNLMRAIPTLRRTPLSYGWVTKRPIPDEVLASWVEPGATDRDVRRDATEVWAGLSPRFTLEASGKLSTFRKPALIVWTPQNRFFPVSLAHRLQRALPGARLELVDDAGIFVSEDQPDRLAELIESFVPSARTVEVVAQGQNR